MDTSEGEGDNAKGVLLGDLPNQFEDDRGKTGAGVLDEAGLWLDAAGRAAWVVPLRDVTSLAFEGDLGVVEGDVDE